MLIGWARTDRIEVNQLNDMAAVSGKGGLRLDESRQTVWQVGSPAAGEIQPAADVL